LKCLASKQIPQTPQFQSNLNPSCSAKLLKYRCNPSFPARADAHIRVRPNPARRPQLCIRASQKIGLTRSAPGTGGRKKFREQPHEQRSWKSTPKPKTTPRCGALTRAGTACQRPAIRGRGPFDESVCNPSEILRRLRNGGQHHVSAAHGSTPRRWCLRCA
jgi:hypothetical protein